MAYIYSCLPIIILFVAAGCRQPPRIANDSANFPEVVYVLDHFDLNYDGIVDDFGRSEMTMIVKLSGYTVSQKFDTDVDIVVTGIPPQIPARPNDPQGLIDMRNYRVVLEEYQAYADTVAEAQEGGIPVVGPGYFDRHR